MCFQLFCVFVRKATYSVSVKTRNFRGSCFSRYRDIRRGGKMHRYYIWQLAVRARNMPKLLKSADDIYQSAKLLSFIGMQCIWQTRKLHHVTATKSFTIKKFSCRRGTTRCVESVEILPIATHQCRNYLYHKSWTNRSYEVGELQWGNVSLTCALNHDPIESLPLSYRCHKQTDHGRVVDITQSDVGPNAERCRPDVGRRAATSYRRRTTDAHIPLTLCSIDVGPTSSCLMGLSVEIQVIKFWNWEINSKVTHDSSQFGLRAHRTQDSSEPRHFGTRALRHRESSILMARQFGP